MPYKHGLYFSEILAENINDLISRVNNNKASLLIISGGVGEGKTTLLVHILDYINKMKGLPPIDLSVKESVQLSMGGADFLHKLRLCHEQGFPCIGYDEAGDFTKRGALTHFNAMMNRTFDTFRAFKIIVVMALPNFNVLDQDLIDKKIPRLLLNLKERTNSQGNFQGYSLYRIDLLKAYMKSMKIKNYAFVKVKPNIYGHFLDLPKDRSDLLDKLSTINKLDILRSNEVAIQGLLNYQQLAKRTYRSVPWVRLVVNKLQLKPVRIIKKVMYFDEDTLNILNQYAEEKSERPDRRSNRK